MPEQKSVTAIVLAYNKHEYTRLCLEGLWRTDYRPLDIVVVNNGSTDGTAAMLDDAREKAASAGVTITILTNDHHCGAPGARNQAIAAAVGEWLIFLDNDVVPFQPGWLTRMAAGMQSLPQAGAVSARLLYPFEPHRVQFAGCAVSPKGRIQYIGRGAQRDDPTYQIDREVQCLISACLMMPASVVLAAGGFDESYHPVQYEDLDLCYKIRDAGWRCYVLGGAEAYHFENTTTDGSGDINFKYVTIKNGILFKNRWRHRFSEEGGPPDSEMPWLPIQHRILSEMGPEWAPWEDAPSRPSIPHHAGISNTDSSNKGDSVNGRSTD